MNPHERQPASDADATRATMSAWADAQADAGDAALALWAADAEARRAWHAYHLIGDVLRSEDLAGAAGRDEDVLNRVRARLADEPAIVAPAAAGPSRAALARARRRRWSFGAVAAGFVMVAGVAGLMQQAGDSALPAGQSLARATPETAPARLARVAQAAPATAAPVAAASSEAGAPGSTAASDPQWRMLDGQVIRDARLDAYLRAHRGIGSVSGRFETVVLDR